MKLLLNHCSDTTHQPDRLPLPLTWSYTWCGGFPSNEVRKNIRTDNQSLKCLPPLSEYSLCSRNKDDFFSSPGRTVQSQFRPNSKRSRLLRRVWCARSRLLCR